MVERQNYGCILLMACEQIGLEDRVLTGVIFITIIKPPSFLSPHNSSLDDVFQRYAHYSYQKRF